MTTSPETSPLASSDPVTGSGSPLRIGIGGPVGSGKTALIAALVPLFVDA
ncbi:MAG: urease accessory protein UreG, partial [Corynebacterium variabile]|nr:urease accessory protein UreG [Corynebacterium variabile]